MRPKGTVGRVAFVFATLFWIGCSSSPQTAERHLGSEAPLGNGAIATYADLTEAGAPSAIGLVLSAGALDALPSTPSDGHRCYDADQNDDIDVHTECSEWHERVLPLPSPVTRRSDIPFKWVLLNWNPHGHMPPGVWDTPHFDVHFYIERIEKIFALQRGPCGPEFMRCDQFERATRPVPANYMHPDFKDVGAAAPAMGNHLIDPAAPEFHGEPFRRHWIFGVYDGRVIFYEEMVSNAYLRSRPDACFDIKSPPAVGLAGYYPARSCVRYDAGTDSYTVSLEAFRYREASPPDPIPEPHVQEDLN